jgi:GNAT superfamily N-acetyltransferase
MTPLQLLVGDVQAWGPTGPLHGSRSPENGVLLCVKALPKSGRLKIEHFWVSPDLRNTGLGGKTLRRLLALADFYGIDVILRPSAYDRQGGLTTTQLKAWYAKHGFVKLNTQARNTGHMLRKALAHYLKSVHSSVQSRKGSAATNC